MELQRPSKIFRYSERRWLERSLKFGEFRLRPASDYLSEEPSKARADDEMNRTYLQKKGTFELRFDGHPDPIETLGDITWTSSIDRDYYLLCFSDRWDPSLFDAFEGSDACLVINWRDEFFEFFQTALAEQFPGWISFHSPVTYDGNMDVGVPFSKPPHLAYQGEHRLILVPPEPIDLMPIVVRLGNIEPFGLIVGTDESQAVT